MKTVINFNNEKSEDTVDLVGKLKKKEISLAQYFDRVDSAMHTSSLDEFIYLVKAFSSIIWLKYKT
jgi:hypothetical protein